MVRGARRAGWSLIAGALALGVLAGSARAVPSPAAKPSAPAYADPGTTRIYRFHVYSTMKARWKKTVTIDTLVSTSKSGLATGDRGLLQRMIETKAGSDWAPVAKIVVSKVLPKGRVEVKIESEEAEAKVRRNGKLPYAPGQKIRLQIDREMS
ncbi:MAG TPA: hypothetical protein VHE30_13795 [Polyangiaceae bacterium]|nr:hypothetical protein [Polyangiaceae bacterium]